MIEGTKTYKGKSPIATETRLDKDLSGGSSATPPLSKPETLSAPQNPKTVENWKETTKTQSEVSPQPAPSATNAVNLDRRKWMSSLVPAFGEGLVKLLRESNHLKSELHEVFKEKSLEITKSDASSSSEK